MDSLRNLAALPTAGRPHPLKNPQGARQEYLRALALGPGFLRPGGHLAAATRRRRAPSRLQPVTEQTSSEGPPLVLPWTPSRTCLQSRPWPAPGNPLPVPTTVPGLRGQFSVRHRTHYTGILNESRRDIASWIELKYKHVRLHSALGYRTPNEVECELLALTKAA